jgi:carboxylate-amine ligase
LRRSIGDLVERLEPVAERLGCIEDLNRINQILDRGSSATRQREIFAETRDLARVVDALVQEMESGSPQPLPSGDLVGGTVVQGDPLAGE